MPNFYVINNPHVGTDNYSNMIHAIQAMPNILAWHDTKYAGHATYLAKMLAKKTTDPTAVILAVGDNCTLNEVLNGLLAVKRDVKIPLTYIPTGLDPTFLKGTHIAHASEVVSQLQKINHSQLLNVGKICGDAPHQTTRYFVNRIDIGCHAITAEKSEQETQHPSSLMHALFKMLTPLLSKPAVPITQQPFQMTILNGKHYRQITNTTLMTIKNQPYFNDNLTHLDCHKTVLNLVITEKMSIVNFLTMLPSFIKNSETPHLKAAHHISLADNANIHIHDIQTGYMDGKSLGNGTFAFTVQHEVYPFWL
ncbi:diacylglycerol/lipid kinase family protein [Leuconostoc rapi]|uniref:diacylglycerol/lipid kinase family protein n=1 Tax=Leuconostoc rapi TaxID=1406906 RepID=UPI00195885F7|nr:diacylglycerol kinase family protein [Leuconostoc rapi]MBM7435386.1 diacylglycerol kinase family enzyme [Leuconostoc rapi]